MPCRLEACAVRERDDPRPRRGRPPARREFHIKALVQGAPMTEVAVEQRRALRLARIEVFEAALSLGSNSTRDLRPHGRGRRRIGTHPVDCDDPERACASHGAEHDPEDTHVTDADAANGRIAQAWTGNEDAATVRLRVAQSRDTGGWDGGDR